MNIPTWILSVALAGATAWAGWMSLSIVDLKGELSALRIEVKHAAAAAAAANLNR